TSPTPASARSARRSTATRPTRRAAARSWRGASPRSSPPGAPAGARRVRSPAAADRRTPSEDVAAHDGLLAAGAHRDDVDARAAQLLEAVDIVAARAREIVEAAAGADVALPAGELLVHRLEVFEVRDVRHRVVPVLALADVAGADPQRR